MESRFHDEAGGKPLAGLARHELVRRVPWDRRRGGGGSQRELRGEEAGTDLIAGGSVEVAADDFDLAVELHRAGLDLDAPALAWFVRPGGAEAPAEKRDVLECDPPRPDGRLHRLAGHEVVPERREERGLRDDRQPRLATALGQRVLGGQRLIE